MSLSWSEAASRLSGNEPPADLTIESVRVSPSRSPFPGDDVEVEVVARDTSGIQGTVAGYCIVEASHLRFADAPIVFHCATFDGGSTFTFDRVCSICRGHEQEFFEMPDHSVDLEIVVGGANRELDCQSHQDADTGTTTDTATITLTPPELSISHIQTTSCFTPSPAEVAPGEQVSLSGRVYNASPFNAIAAVQFEWVSADTGEVLATSQVNDLYVPAEEFTDVDAPMTPPVTGSGPVQMDVVDVREP